MNRVPDAEEVRALVRTVVDAVLSGDRPVAGDARSDDSVAETVPSAPVTTPAAGGIAIGADHGGYRLKERLAFRLRERGETVVDCGTDSADSVDYPDFALAVAEKVASGECPVGIVVDGAGIGSAMAANKVPGVRAGLAYDLSSARNAREHNHANVLTLGAGLIGDSLAWQIVEAWLDTPWGEGRHARRVTKIDAIEERFTGRKAVG